MKFKGNLRFYLANAKILLGKTSEYDHQLEDLHFELLKTEFYQEFRQSVFTMLTKLRTEVISKKDNKINYMLTSQYLEMVAMQKIASSLLLRHEFQKTILLGVLFKRKVVYPIFPNFSFSGGQQFIGLHNGASVFLMNTFQTMQAIVKIIRYVLFNFGIISRDEYFKVVAKLQYNQDFCVDPVWGNLGINPNQLNQAFFNWIHQNLETNSSSDDNLEVMDLIRLTSNVSKIKFLNHLIGVIIHTSVTSRKSIKYLLQNLDFYLIGYMFQLNPPNFKYILYPNSWYISEPLWNASLRKLKIEVIFYHYAIWTEPQSSNLETCVDGFWQLSTWNNLWVIDQLQHKEMRELLSDNHPAIKITGVPIQTSSNRHKFPGNRGIVSIFDTHIQPREKYTYGRLDELGWSDSRLETSFLEIVLEVAREYDLFVVHKKKRKKPSRRVENFVSEVSPITRFYSDAYELVDESERAETLILASDIVIAKPISTVALLARQLSKPVCYLDPTGMISQDDPGLRGIKIARSKNELVEFVADALANIQRNHK